MITVSATELRKHLFKYLDKAAAGETIIIQRNKKNVACLMPEAKANWRDGLRQTLEINVSSEELMQPLTGSLRARYDRVLDSLGKTASLEETKAFLAERETAEPEEGLTEDVIARLEKRIADSS